MSRGSAPAMAASSRAASSTVRVMGPITSRVVERYIIPPRPTRPSVGLRPTAPQSAAGIRTEPPVSVPTAAAQNPDATAPPGVEVVLDGDGDAVEGGGRASLLHEAVQPLGLLERPLAVHRDVRVDPVAAVVLGDPVQVGLDHFLRRDLARPELPPELRHAKAGEPHLGDRRLPLRPRPPPPGPLPPPEPERGPRPLSGETPADPWSPPSSLLQGYRLFVLAEDVLHR